LLYFIVFVAISILLYIIFFPSIMNWLILPVTHVGEQISGPAILNWKLCFQNLTTTQLSLTGFFLLLALMLFVYSAIKKDDKFVGTEYGTAKWLSDDLFNKLVPQYVFHINEYDYDHPDLFAGFEVYEEKNVLDVLEVNTDEQ